MPDHQTSFAIPFHENSMKTAIPTCIHFYDKLIVLNVEAAAGGLYILKCFIISSSSMIQNTSIEIFSNSIVPHFHFLLLSETISPHLLSPPSNQEDTLLCPNKTLYYCTYLCLLFCQMRREGKWAALTIGLEQTGNNNDEERR